MNWPRLPRWLPWLMLLLWLAYVAWVLIWARAQRSAPLPPPSTLSQSELRKRGEYLVKLGNCAACHTARGGAPWAGGRAFETPFGTVYSGNLTPHPEHGLGRWTADDFWRAMHEGKSRDGHFLNPVFPYQNFAAIARDDSDAMFAWLQQLPAQAAPRRAHALRWPFNTQFSLALWRALYVEPQAALQEAPQDGMARGAYLARGLGHCSACHAPRDRLGGFNPASLGGGKMPVSGWYAPPLLLQERWEEADLRLWLASGQAARHAAYGPMAEVIFSSMQYWKVEDIALLAAWLKAQPGQTLPPHLQLPKLGQLQPEEAQIAQRGKQLYQKHCAECHGEQGQGVPGVYPALNRDSSVQYALPENALRLILHGGFAPATGGNPRPYGMPPFAMHLSEQEVADVLSWLRVEWGGAAKADPAAAQNKVFISAPGVAQMRSLPAE
ncbi:cytochrome c [Massilia sp. W12]|uniref:c-type cytochrome n=1 Tax=Massilia sp. W12 TaxID=3126507 RepID=UPI0030CCCDFB